MLIGAMPHRPLETARTAVRRSLLRHHIQSVVAGKAEKLTIDLGDPDLDAAALVIEAASTLRRDAPAYARLLAAVKHPRLADRVVDGLGSRDPTLKSRCARMAGAFRMEEAVPCIAPLLWSKEPVVRASAARALGKIGGIRSADALLMAVQRLGPKPVLIVALARAAPDLYLEGILSGKQPRVVQPAVAIAAGLRRRRTAIAPLVAQMSTGSSRLRTAGGRALGWIGAAAGIAALNDSLEHRDWRVRMAAAKALGAIDDFRPGTQIFACLVDRNVRVRTAAHSAVRRRGGVSPVIAEGR